ncbi:hypothetical protein CKAN_01388500 [Cinnamomum micranthum f. kanehirae]|uniref:Uncharacterized protein n=1 Tax=Cinnamomum micranthum f. kanehirae TaxID=337451 RepID=A0A3S3MJU4_9MAGN|nr:hypothetical protein CKAN_01388500 [Cinnamomum micranthum f. kanehirae]
MRPDPTDPRSVSHSFSREKKKTEKEERRRERGSAGDGDAPVSRAQTAGNGRAVGRRALRTGNGWGFVVLAVESGVSVAHRKKVMDKSYTASIGKGIESMIKNGRLNASSSLDLQQVHKLTQIWIDGQGTTWGPHIKIFMLVL